MTKNKALTIVILYTAYALLFWMETTFFNFYFVEGEDFFGLMKTGSILQLPIVVAAWIAFYDKYISASPKFTRD